MFLEMTKAKKVVIQAGNSFVAAFKHKSPLKVSTGLPKADESFFKRYQKKMYWWSHFDEPKCKKWEWHHNGQYS